MLRRLDAELVRRHLARSRDHAQELIAGGFVVLDGVVADKAARQVSETVSISLRTDSVQWVSRGAHKLLGALAALPAVDMRGKHVLDAGASAGGFTQVALSRGASSVTALDVGYGQLAWQLRQDPRVNVIERFNVRNLTANDLPHPIDMVVADLSFISLRTVLPAITASVLPTADLLLMVKPQFEVGREQAGNGVVRDPELRIGAVAAVVQAAADLGWHLAGVGASPLPGPQGNVEYFVWLNRRAEAKDAEQCEHEIRSAVAAGPQ